MFVAYTNHIGHSARDKYSGKNTAISTINDLTATEKHNNHDYNQEAVTRMQSDINLDLRTLNSQYEMQNGKLVEIEGHLDLEANVRKIYDEQFAEAVAKYNERQIAAGHPERQIESYIEKISDNKQQEIAVEGLIQFGCLEDWEDMTLEDREKAVPLLLDCLKETLNVLKTNNSEFVLAGASVHMNEGTPHIHYVGVPVETTPNAKHGMEKRVRKSAVFNKDSLGAGLQDTVRAKIEPKLKEAFGWEFEEKRTGRNEDLEKRILINEKLKKQIKEKEIEIEILDGKHNAIMKHTKDKAEAALQEVKQQVAEEVFKSPDKFSAGIAYLVACDDEERERITSIGQNTIIDVATRTLSIDELINTALKAGKGTLSQEERNMLWDEYRARRDTLSVWMRSTATSLSLAKHNAYDKLSVAKQHLYDANKMLRHSKSLFETLFAFTMIIIESKKVKKLQTELDDVKNQYKDYQHEYNVLKQSQRIAAEDLLHCADSAQNALNSMKRFLETSDRVLKPDMQKHQITVQEER